MDGNHGIAVFNWNLKHHNYVSSMPCAIRKI